ncbi:MAG: hypothetical protein J2P22_15285 [Nocardioides sp.]|nr:hypothetical protein [Nocardioides sp.]
MRRRLGTVVAVAALMASAGCGSQMSPPSVGEPDSPGPGPVHGARVLPLISMTGGGGRVSLRASPLNSDAQMQRFASQFRAPALAGRVTDAAANAATSGYPVYGAVVAIGCDRPPGADVSLDADGRVLITPREVVSPLPECLAAVTTVAIATVPGAD